MIKALDQFIIIQKDPIKETKEKGVIIPASSQRTPRFGPTVLATVVSVGAKAKTVRVGDRVAVKDIAGDDLYHDNQTYTRMREKDIVGVADES
jgi:co-chaperonin GroES (HSP10)